MEDEYKQRINDGAGKVLTAFFGVCHDLGRGDIGYLLDMLLHFSSAVIAVHARVPDAITMFSKNLEELAIERWGDVKRDEDGEALTKIE